MLGYIDIDLNNTSPNVFMSDRGTAGAGGGGTHEAAPGQVCD